ncbi:MAG: UDP-N-acetylmuramoyl-tripeptide--D-alanyl-D-alanine ligase [Arenicella sp.]|nr:UDP-N-acetylmuramoyl-tripeptide--D-alanyl-D-alanine ligase [Arenicella sp.]
MMQLSQVATAVNGEMHGNDVMLRGVATDTRADCEGRLFVALKGENFDAHDFVSQAQHRGAFAALIERHINLQIPTVVVDSSHQALLDLAAWWRAQFSLPVIGVTGSVGKTSVKEMLGSIFAEIGNGVVTRGNLNNEIGVPLTLLRLVQGDQYAIIEMGMNHAGEIARLSKITKPTIALINNAAAAHLQELKSVAEVARAKAEIFLGLDDEGIALINLDDEFAGQWIETAGSRRIVTFGLHQDADVNARFELRPASIFMQVNAFETSFEVEMQVIGEHNVRNALAAIAVARAANIPVRAIRAGLKIYRPLGGRLSTHKFAQVTIYDDSYNANPASMQAAINTLSQFNDTTLIVGDMAELGAAADQAHIEVGKYARDKGVNRLLACGEYASLVADGFGPGAKTFPSQVGLIESLLAAGAPQGFILVKGSRSARMERVVKALIDLIETDNGGES